MFCLELGCMIHFDSHALQADRVESSATTVVNNGGMLLRYLVRSVDGIQFYKPGSESLLYYFSSDKIPWQEHPKSYVDQILAANIVPQVRPEVEQSGHSLAGLAPRACSVSPPGAGEISDNSSGNFGEATSLVSATPQPMMATSPTLGPHRVPAMSHATSHGRGAWASSPTPGDRNQQPTSTLVATWPGTRAHMEPGGLQSVPTGSRADPGPTSIGTAADGDDTVRERQHGSNGPSSWDLFCRRLEASSVRRAGAGGAGEMAADRLEFEVAVKQDKARKQQEWKRLLKLGQNIRLKLGIDYRKTFQVEHKGCMTKTDFAGHWDKYQITLALCFLQWSLERWPLECATKCAACAKCSHDDDLQALRSDEDLQALAANLFGGTIADLRPKKPSLGAGSTGRGRGRPRTSHADGEEGDTRAETETVLAEWMLKPEARHIQLLTDVDTAAWSCVCKACNKSLSGRTQNDIWPLIKHVLRKSHKDNVISLEAHGGKDFCCEGIDFSWPQAEILLLSKYPQTLAKWIQESCPDTTGSPVKMKAWVNNEEHMMSRAWSCAKAGAKCAPGKLWCTDCGRLADSVPVARHLAQMSHKLERVEVLHMRWQNDDDGLAEVVHNLQHNDWNTYVDMGEFADLEKLRSMKWAELVWKVKRQFNFKAEDCNPALCNYIRLRLGLYKVDAVYCVAVSEHRKELEAAAEDLIAGMLWHAAS